MKNIGRYRLRIELAVRWLVWLVWVVVWPVVIWNVSPGLLVLILLVSVWIVGGWFGFFFWGPGMIIGRILGVREAREQRRFKELNDRFSMLGPGEGPGYEFDEFDIENIDRELKERENDLTYAYTASEGGKGGRDFLVVPSHVRPWFPPYDDGDTTVVHEDSYGLSGDWVVDSNLLDVPFDLDDAEDENWEEDDE